MEFLFSLGAWHGVIIIFLAAIIIYTDHQGLLYVLGKKERLSSSFLRISHRLIWIGLLAMISTGLLLAIPMWEYLKYELAFFVKMFFVVVLFVNAFSIGQLSQLASRYPYAELSSREKKKLLVAGVLSSTGWVVAASIGLFFL